MTNRKLYRVIFVNQDEVFEIYATRVSTSEIFGFVEVEQWVFGERSQLLVDPAEERLKGLFSGVTRSFIPMNAIIRMDEVEQQGTARISTVRSATVSNINRPPPRKET